MKSLIQVSLLCIKLSKIKIILISIELTKYLKAVFDFVELRLLYFRVGLCHLNYFTTFKEIFTNIIVFPNKPTLLELSFK